MTPCEGIPYSAETGRLECLKAAEGRYRSMCVHEHERISALCLVCAGRAGLCSACYEIDGHHCRLWHPPELLEELRP